MIVVQAKLLDRSPFGKLIALRSGTNTNKTRGTLLFPCELTDHKDTYGGWMKSTSHNLKPNGMFRFPENTNTCSGFSHGFPSWCEMECATIHSITSRVPTRFLLDGTMLLLGCMGTRTGGYHMSLSKVDSRFKISVNCTCGRMAGIRNDKFFSSAPGA